MRLKGTPLISTYSRNRPSGPHADPRRSSRIALSRDSAILRSVPAVGRRLHSRACYTLPSHSGSPFLIDLRPATLSSQRHHMTTHQTPIRTPSRHRPPTLDPTVPRHNITDRWLRSVKVPTRTDFVDSTLQDFGVRVSPEGRRTFFVRYRRNGRRFREKLGTYPITPLADARARAQAKLRALQANRNPEHAGITFGDMVGRYLDDAPSRLKQKTIYSVERSIERDALPFWRALPFSDLDRDAVRELLNRVHEGKDGRDAAPGSADRLRSYLSSLWTWAIDAGLAAEPNPVRSVKRRHRTEPRDRVLSDAEMLTLWNRWESVYTSGRSDAVVSRTLFQVLLLTGLRMGEAMGGKLSEIDGVWWTIPSARMKNRKPHAVYVTDTLRALLDRLSPWRARNPWAFPSRDYRHAMVDPKRAYQSDVEATGVKFSPHVLRHTFVTGLSRIGVPEFVKQRCVAHVPRNITAQVYDHYAYSAEKRDAWMRWEAHVLEVTGHRSTPPLPESETPPPAPS